MTILQKRQTTIFGRERHNYRAGLRDIVNRFAQEHEFVPDTTLGVRYQKGSFNHPDGRHIYFNERDCSMFLLAPDENTIELYYQRGYKKEERLVFSGDEINRAGIRGYKPFLREEYGYMDSAQYRQHGKER